MPGNLEAGPHPTRTDVRNQDQNPYAARVSRADTHPVAEWKRAGPRVWAPHVADAVLVRAAVGSCSYWPV